MEKQMLYTYEVYKYKSFSKAAENLYISQPAFSAIILKLEYSLGTQIFDRSTKPISLTEAGEYYISCIEQIMNIEKGMNQYFEDIQGLKKGSIRIGASSYFCGSILPLLLKDFNKEYPQIRFTIEENNSTPELKEKLISKELDFALTSNTYPDHLYDEISLYKEAIILCVPKDNPVNDILMEYCYSYDEMIALGKKDLSEVKRISLEELKKEEFLTIDRNSDLYPRIINMFKPYGIVPNITMHLQQMSSCYYMAANGFGCAFLRHATLLTVKDTGNLWFYFIDSPLASRDVRIYHKRGGYISNAMSAFIKWVQNANV